MGEAVRTVRVVCDHCWNEIGQQVAEDNLPQTIYETCQSCAEREEREHAEARAAGRAADPGWQPVRAILPYGVPVKVERWRDPHADPREENYLDRAAELVPELASLIVEDVLGHIAPTDAEERRMWFDRIQRLLAVSADTTVARLCVHYDLLPPFPGLTTPADVHPASAVLSGVAHA